MQLGCGRLELSSNSIGGDLIVPWRAVACRNWSLKNRMNFEKKEHRAGRVRAVPVD